MNKLTFGMMLLITMVVFAVPVAADQVFYLVPQDSTGDPGDEVTVWVMLNASDTTDAFDAEICFDLDVVNITAWENPGSIWDWWDLGHHGNYVHIGGMDFGGGSSGVLGIAKLTLKGNDLGISSLNFNPPKTGCGFQGNALPNFVLINGTFTCGAIQTFSKELPAGWNLISLPFGPTDDSTSAVLSTVTYNAVKQYNAATKQFEDATIMDPGTGYFVHVTTASTWEYIGTPESSTTTQLESGLNMMGVPNCAKSVSDVMGSTDYRYAARWNAILQSYEVYNPNAPAAFHGFTTMEPGEGYFVSAGSNSALTVTCP